MNLVALIGGLGYIGSHIAIELIEKGIDFVIFDNESNSDVKTLDTLNNYFKINIKYHKIDILDFENFNKIFCHYKFNTVIHLAGLKSVFESSREPLSYFENNINGIINILKVIKNNKTKNLIFSSSASIYEETFEQKLINEEHNLNPKSVYGKTKKMAEDIIINTYKELDINVIILRYFNPVSSHPLVNIKENMKNPNNLFPIIAEIILNKREYLSIYGNDYSTNDGTCVRDYIHVVDLAKSHVSFLDFKTNFGIYNVGTGTGYSVLEIINKINEYLDTKINYKFVDRRLGDVAFLVADNKKIKKEVGWEIKYNLNDICKHFINNLNK